MTRFAIIETNSGFVWGVTDAADAIEACRIMDADIGNHGRTYTEGTISDLRSSAGAYDVRVAPAGFDVDNGQDDAAIAAVDAMPRAAIVLMSDEEG